MSSFQRRDDGIGLGRICSDVLEVVVVRDLAGTCSSAFSTKRLEVPLGSCRCVALRHPELMRGSSTGGWEDFLAEQQKATPSWIQAPSSEAQDGTKKVTENGL